MKKLFSLLLVLALVVSCFAACGGGDDTTAAPSGDNTDDTTVAPAGDDTTAAPAGDDTTAAPVIPEDPVDEFRDILQEDGSVKNAKVEVKGVMNFDTDDVAAVGGYIASCEGFGGMSQGGGAIKDGKLVYTSGKANTYAVDKTDSSFYDVRIVEFDLTINKLSTATDSSGYYTYFALMSDGVADENGWAAGVTVNRCYALEGKADGTFRMNGGKGDGQEFTLEEGKTYKITMQIDFVADTDENEGKMTGFVDGEKVYFGTYSLKADVENFFRFINTGFTGDIAIDNFTIMGLDFVDAE